MAPPGRKCADGPAQNGARGRRSGNGAGSLGLRSAGHSPSRRGPFDEPPAKGQVELTVDAAGQVFLRGIVTSEEAAREIEAAARSVPGVTRVESNLQLQVMPRRAEDADAPPPPPEPMVREPSPDRPASPAPSAASRSQPSR